MDERVVFSEFYDFCKAIQAAFDKEWRGAEEWEKEEKLNKEKKAIIGYDEDIAFYKEKIRSFIADMKLEKVIVFPPWYKSLEDGVFAELYGLAGLTPWVYDETEEYRNSSSAKLIGDRLYCLIDGKSKLQPQRIPLGRRAQLKRAFLLSTPSERIEKGFHEIYLHNGIRVSIFSGEKTKDNQEIMVFRKYILKELTFEKMAELGTIPPGSVELFKTMVRLGFNVLFSGQVRAGKTAFMQCWQRYEDTSLEGLAVATDPETMWHVMMPEAPIMQIIADGKDLQSISKALLRGDNDYVLLEEMRDAYAFRLALDITSTGTRRSKATIHSGDSMEIPFKMASAIVAEFGGDYKGILMQVFRNWHYVFEFFQEPTNRGIKRLKSIKEYRYDASKDKVSIHTICLYDTLDKRWKWKWDIGEDKKTMGNLRQSEFKKMESIIKMLEYKNPIMENTVIYPRYYKSDGEERDVR
ncbi:MAG: Flp pilus assembly complex ATPase component TadA [Firmicutes bacterium]|nr:Flp pilus assembly complex ATPase component TadA [Bacillota bacterium]